MRFRPGRLLGVLMGIVILVSIFLVSFASSQSLYSSAQPLLSSVGSVQQSGVFRTEAADYVTIIVFLLLIVAGFVGVSLWGQACLV